MQQQYIFVGREDYLDAFQTNLCKQLPIQWRLFSIYGQGGVGKSTLIRQFEQISQNLSCLTASSNETQTSVIEVLGRLADQLELPQFSERYRVYRKYQQQLDSDPEKPRGMLSLAGRTLAKAGLGAFKQIPVSGAIIPFLDEDEIISQAGEWAAYVAKRLTNRDDIQLVLDPIEVLTPLFLADLNKIAAEQRIVLFFDTYERTSFFLEDWLQALLDNRFGSFPVKLILVIAGREELNPNKWFKNEEIIFRISLKPLTEAEALSYLNRKRITNPQIIEKIIQLSGGLPLLIAILAIESSNDPAQLRDPCDTAIQEFLRWVDDPKQRNIALDAALCRIINQDIIATLQSEEVAAELFSWLKTMPFIQSRLDGWACHEIVRNQMLRYKRLTTPQGWKEIHGKLAIYWNERSKPLEKADDSHWQNQLWQDFSLHAFYHQLCGEPHQMLTSALKGFIRTLRCRYNFALRWAEVLVEAGQASDTSSLISLGEQLINGLRAY